MDGFRIVVDVVVVAGVLLGACATSGNVAEPTAGDESPERPPIIGPTTQAEVLDQVPEWIDDLVRARPDEVQARKLAEPMVDTEVLVFFGTWCSDSRRELTRLWRAIELAGGETGFRVRYVGVDRSKAQPRALLEGMGLVYVPTLIVLRSGAELGRIVESAPNGIEKDLVALLEGEADGWVSGRNDLDVTSKPGATP